jgi:hypothetical protein
MEGQLFGMFLEDGSNVGERFTVKCERDSESFLLIDKLLKNNLKHRLPFTVNRLP